MFCKVNDFYLRPNFTCIVAGSSKAGKTELVRDIVEQWSHVVPESTIGCVSIIYDTWQPCYDEIISFLPPNAIVESHAGLPNSNDELPLPSDSQTETRNGRIMRPMCRIGTQTYGGQHLVLVDDVLQMVKANSFLTRLFSVLSHHNKISTFLITQQIFNNTDLNRNLVRNTEHIIICKSAVASTTLRTLQNQYFVGKNQYLTTAYSKVIACGGRYIHLDLTSNCTDSRRVKSGLLQEEVSYIHKLYCQNSRTFQTPTIFQYTDMGVKEMYLISPTELERMRHSNMDIPNSKAPDESIEMVDDTTVNANSNQAAASCDLEMLALAMGEIPEKHMTNVVMLLKHLSRINQKTNCFKFDAADFGVILDGVKIPSSNFVELMNAAFRRPPPILTTKQFEREKKRLDTPGFYLFLSLLGSIGIPSCMFDNPIVSNYVRCARSQSTPREI